MTRPTLQKPCPRAESRRSRAMDSNDGLVSDSAFPGGDPALPCRGRRDAGEPDPRAGRLREAGGVRARATPEDLRRHLFGPRPHAEAILAEVGGRAGRLRACSSRRSRRSAASRASTSKTSSSGPSIAGRGIGKALLATRGPARRWTGLRPAGVVGARLERPGDRLLSRPGGQAAGRVDRLPARRRAARPARRPRPRPEP